MDNAKIALIHEILIQINRAIIQLQKWNKNVTDMRELEMSEDGMQRLAGNCMLIQAIGEGVKKIDKYGCDYLFHLRPEIPWKQVMSMRDRISHGYFEIDVDYITDIIKNNLPQLQNAVENLIKVIEDDLDKS